MKISKDMKRTTSRPTPRSFDIEFKRTAILAVTDDQRRTAEVAEELGIAASTLQKWVQAARRGQVAGVEVRGFDEQVDNPVDEIRRLRKQVADLTAQRDFLKKTTVFFAKGQS
jgi:transposase